jgi:pyrrolidone-carboxylate peptidase/peptidoglycan hydrolase-like protein with peptidoglycan-binding domain
MSEPLKIPKQEPEYLAMQGRKSINSVAFKWDGNEVKHLQEALLALGYSLHKQGANGKFMPETDAAVRKFQRSHKDHFVYEGKNPPLKVDGIVGPKTALALNCALARRGIWFNDYEHEWTDEEKKPHRIHCMISAQTSINPNKEEKISLHIGGRPLSFLAIDGTASPDADGFAKAMNNVKSTKGRDGKPVRLTVKNIAQRLIEDIGLTHPLSKYVGRSLKGTHALAINLQTEGKDVISKGSRARDSSPAYSHALNLFKKAGILFGDGSIVRPDIFYCAMHASLSGGILFVSDRKRASRHEWNAERIGLFKPRKDEGEIDWGAVKWIILASCGSLSLHYRYFGIPDHGRKDRNRWAHRHNLDLDREWIKKYVLSHYYPGLEWLRIIKSHAVKLHGLLGYWDKSPGGDVGGSLDENIAREFVTRLERGETVLEAWKQRGGPQTKAWAAIVDAKYKDETLEDLMKGMFGDPDERKWMYASLHTGPKDERKKKLIPIPIKEAFLEANTMARYVEDARMGEKKLGNFKLHQDYGWPLKKERFYPDDLMKKRQIAENEKEKGSVVKYPTGDIIESFAIEGKHFSALSVEEMKGLLEKVIGKLSADELKKTYRPIKVLISGFRPWKGSGLDYNPSQIIAEEMDGRIMEFNTDIGRTFVYVSGIVLPVLWYDAADWLIEEIKLGYPDIVIGFGMKAFEKGSKNPEDLQVEIETYASNENAFVSANEKDSKVRERVLDELGRTPKEAIEARAKDLNQHQKTTNLKKIRDDGPDKLPLDSKSEFNIPHHEIKEALNRTKGAIQAFVDDPGRTSIDGLLIPYAGSAGNYVCNQIFYNLAYHNLRERQRAKSTVIVTTNPEEIRRRKEQDFDIKDRSFKYDVMTGFIHVPPLPDDTGPQRKSKLKKTAETIVEVCVRKYVEKEFYRKVNKPMPLDVKEILERGEMGLLRLFQEWELDVWG